MLTHCCPPPPLPLCPQGEEGIDAGGVSREWYAVMAREVFNPNLALFVQVRSLRALLCSGCMTQSLPAAPVSHRHVSAAHPAAAHGAGHPQPAQHESHMKLKHGHDQSRGLK